MNVQFSMLETTWQDDYLLTFENCIYGEDPCFVDPASGDVHLMSQVGRWNADTEAWVNDAATSPGVDAGDPNSDWQAELWPHGKRVNMGAYGNTPQASLSVLNKANIADLSHNDVVDLEDFNLLSGKWDSTQNPLAEDLDRNGIVNILDLAIFAGNWLSQYIDVTVATDKVAYDWNEDIIVSFTNAAGNAADWIGICQKGASIEPWSEAMILWSYTDGTETGTAGITEDSVTFTAGLSEPGEYEVRLFFNDSYDIEDRAFFTVE